MNRVIGAKLLALVLSQVDTASAEIRSMQSAPHGAAPPNVIFDSDMWAGTDDALALAMLHALHDRREINLVAVTISTNDAWCVSYVDLVNTFYGHPQVPIGLVQGGIDAKAFKQKLPSITYPKGSYTQLLSKLTRPDGSWLYPRRRVGKTATPQAVFLLRKTLAAQPDGSVVMIQVGYSTNLAGLLGSEADTYSGLDGRHLVKRKVRQLSIMAGNFRETQTEGPKGSPEFNLLMDTPSAQRLFSEWPTPIVASGVEVGAAMLYPARSIARDYSYVEHHPIAEAYRSVYVQVTSRVEGKEQKIASQWPRDDATCDLTSVLYAARPDNNYFSVSKPGRVTVLADGTTRFDEVEGGKHRYLILNEAQKARTLEAMVMLASQPPVAHAKQ
jgi:inosine-uridine nucleoside N-ribohydrolase